MRSAQLSSQYNPVLSIFYYKHHVILVVTVFLEGQPSQPIDAFTPPKKTNVTTEKLPFEDVYPIKKSGDFPAIAMLVFEGVYLVTIFQWMFQVLVKGGI